MGADFKADVYLIPCYGQSLALNVAAGPSTLKYTDPLIYDITLQNTNIQDMCAGTAEGFRLAAEYYGIKIPEKFKIMSCLGGAGGTSVAELSKGTRYYEELMQCIKQAKSNCDKAGLSMCVPCFTWTQGEEDMRAGGTPENYGYGVYDPFTYKDRLIKLIEDFNEDVKEITGQTCDVVCISDQLASHTTFCRYPRIALQIGELAQDYDKMVLAKVMYDLDYVRERDSVKCCEVHAYARSYRNIGNMYGVAAFYVSVLNKKYECCRPLEYHIRDNIVQIRFETPFKPLVLDTELVRQQPDGNFGFQVYQVEELPGENGRIAKAVTQITKVQLCEDDMVEVVLDRKPCKGERLTYGVNGDYWQNIGGIRIVLTGGEGEDHCTKAGRLYGSRGCLRDSQPIQNNNQGAVFTRLYNWCTIFEILF